MKSLPLDYTFCSGLRCPKTITCARHTSHLFNSDSFSDKKPISLANFSDHNGDCDNKYIPLDDEETQPKIIFKDFNDEGDSDEQSQ